MADRLTVLPDGLTLRPAMASDRDFLRELCATTRIEGSRQCPDRRRKRRAFVAVQFDAQDAAYHGAYPDGEFHIVLVDGEAVGRLYLGRLPGELRIIDVTLTPEERGQGIGTALMRWVLGRADRDALSATLHVELWNPAKRLYQRLGFRTVELRGIYEFMRRPVPAQLKTAS